MGCFGARESIASFSETLPFPPHRHGERQKERTHSLFSGSLLHHHAKLITPGTLTEIQFGKGRGIKHVNDYFVWRVLIMKLLHCSDVEASPCNAMAITSVGVCTHPGQGLEGRSLQVPCSPQALSMQSMGGRGGTERPGLGR